MFTIFPMLYESCLHPYASLNKRKRAVPLFAIYLGDKNVLNAI